MEREWLRKESVFIIVKNDYNSLISFFSVAHRKAKAVYPCEAEHSSELSFQIGAIFEDGKYCLSKYKAMKNKLTILLKWLWIKIQA